MINVTIYLKEEFNANDLAKELLQKKLIATASIDANNISYIIKNGEFAQITYSVITAQSKALLFNEIVKTVEALIGASTPINATPIVGSNTSFDDLIISKTLKI